MENTFLQKSFIKKVTLQQLRDYTQKIISENHFINLSLCSVKIFADDLAS